VIIALHHEQDMRKMGGLFKYMKITAVTCWIGGLALIGTPFFAGFYSKDAIIEAVGESHQWAAPYAYWCVLLGVFVTALYTFRMIFLTFHGPERFGSHEHAHGHEPHGEHAALKPHESPWVVTVPLILLAIPSVVIGYYTVGPVLFGNYFGGAIGVLENHDVIGELAQEFHGPAALALHALLSAPFWLAAAGVATAYLFFLKNPVWADIAQQRAQGLYKLLINKYYFDWVNENVIAPLARGVGRLFWKGGDEALIDGVIVNGSARGIGVMSAVVRHIQSGYLYHYAFAMIIGLCALVAWLLTRP
jgi:NADH-quinone oxidoreductase subunit L